MDLPNEFNDDDATDAENVSETDNVDNNNEQTKKRVSVMWGGHFKKLSDFTAECNYCQKKFSFRGGISNLKKHIRRRHRSVTLDEPDGEFETIINPTSSPQTEPQHTRIKRRRSKGWKFFDMKDPARRIATCKGCKKDVSYQTVSNLMKHVARANCRAISGFNISDDEENPDLRTAARSDRCITRNTIQKKFRSSVWKYFDVADGEARLATCRLCSRNFSFNSLTNLKKHVYRKHDVKLGAASDDESEITADIEGSSPVWAYYKCLDEALKIASCLICKERVEYNDDLELTRHLRRKHPGVDLDELKTKPKKLMITGDGEIYEIDDNVIAKEEPIAAHDDGDSDSWPHNNDEVEALHAEYLDEDMSDELEHVASTKRRKHTNQTSPNTQTTEEDSLDIFGKYMASLLKKLPKQKSDQLQVEFVKRIMETQLRSTQSNRSKPMSIGYKSRSNQNTRYSSQSANNDDTRVTSNSEVQNVVFSEDVKDLVLSHEQVIVTSVGDEVTVGSE